MGGVMKEAEEMDNEHTRTYWVRVTHFATPEVLKDKHHLPLDEAVNEVRQALEQGWVIESGCD
jgi:ribulose bisphosphate carboxylase small subunit